MNILFAISFRTYEERELRFLNEKKEKLKNWDNQLQRLKMELDYLRGEDKMGWSLVAL